jgi:signal transduction histidine kinase
MDTIKLSKRLFFKQTRNAILVALSLGVILSIGQIFFDFRVEQERIDRTVRQVINTAKESASQAAYNLNTELANRVINGLFEYDPIHFAQINDDFGRQLAMRERPAVTHNLEWLGPFMDAGSNYYRVPLYIQEDQETIIGEMRVQVDRFLIAQNFLQRAGFVVLLGILRNTILAIIFGFLFYFTLGRPFMVALNDLNLINPQAPGQHKLTVSTNHRDDELGLISSKMNKILDEFDQTLQQRFHAENELKKKQETIEQLNQHLEERVRQRTGELEATNKEMEAFTYSVSHDLRAPLRTVSGFSDILLDEYGDQLDDQALHYLGRVRTGTQRMEELINDMLKLSRSTRGELHQNVIDISALVHEIAEDLYQAYPEQDVNLQIQPNIRIKADKRFLRLVLENLLSNAWKYTSKKDQGVIRFGITKQDDETVFYLSDNGAGFDMSYAEKLFSPFHRLHSAKEFEGNGVGLATVQRIIHRHGGDVWAEAEVDKGATFYFTLPDSENTTTHAYGI